MENSFLQYKLIIFINLFCLNILFRNTRIIKIYLFYSYFRIMSTPELNNLPGVSTEGPGRPLLIYMNICIMLSKYIFLFVYECVHVCIYACVCVFICQVLYIITIYVVVVVGMTPRTHTMHTISQFCFTTSLEGN